jgi:hypothetical protein
MASTRGEVNYMEGFGREKKGGAAENMADSTGALLWPIFLVAIISWPRSTAVTAFPYTELGNSNFDFFKNVVSARGFSLIGPHNINWSAYANGRTWIALVSDDDQSSHYSRQSVYRQSLADHRSPSSTSISSMPQVLWSPCPSKLDYSIPEMVISRDPQSPS